ncbi:MAG: aldo/keto reductase, partial [bacterium]
GGLADAVVVGNVFDEIGLGREEFVVATKVRGPMSEQASEGTGDYNNIGLSRKHIMEGCRRSLARLGLDTIDLYQVHGWDPETPIEETMKALNDLVRQGHVNYIGVSNWTARHIMKSLELSRRNDWAEFQSLQAYYSLANRDLEHELMPLCEEEGLGILPWSPLAGGLMTGKYTRDGDGPEGARRVEFDFPPVKPDKSFKAVDQLEEFAEKRDSSIPRLALAWVLDRPAVDSVIIGASNMEQLEDNLESVSLQLTEEERETLDNITTPPSLYPEWMVQLQSTGELPDNVG